MELNNAATSQVLDNPAVIPVLSTTANLYFYLFYVTVSLILNSYFYNTVLSDKKVSLFKLLFQIRPENQTITRVIEYSKIVDNKIT